MDNQAAGSEDARLLERIARRDHAAFTLLVRRHASRFYRVAQRVLRDRIEAQDVVQEAFLKLWEKPALWRSDKSSAFTTWFYRIVVNQCIDYARKKRPLQLVDDTWIADERETCEQALLQEERTRVLKHHVDRLPERQRIALILCSYEGLSNQEAAEVMQLHLKALQSLLIRAKKTLKEQLRFIVEV